MLGQVGCDWEKDLRAFATCLIHLPQLPKSISLIHILWQPARPEMVNQRPILVYISSSPHGYYNLTEIIKPWPIMQMHATGLSGTVFMVAMVALVAKYYGEQVILLPTPCT